MEIKGVYENTSCTIVIDEADTAMMRMMEARRFPIPTVVQNTLTMIGMRSNINVRHDVLFKLKDKNGKLVGYGKGMMCNTASRLRSFFVMQAIGEFHEVAIRLGFNPTASAKGKGTDLAESGVCAYVYRDSEVKV